MMKFVITPTAYLNTRTSHRASYPTSSLIRAAQTASDFQQQPGIELSKHIGISQMKVARTFPALLLFAIATSAIAQEDLPAQPRRDFRYSLAVINDATVDSNLC